MSTSFQVTHRKTTLQLTLHITHLYSYILILKLTIRESPERASNEKIGHFDLSLCIYLLRNGLNVLQKNNECHSAL